MRYERANLQTPAQTFTGGGTSAAVNVATSSIQSLSARLEQFSNMKMAQAGQEAQTEAARDAGFDIVKRRNKIANIRKNIPSVHEQTNQIDKLMEGARQADETIYGRAYNTAAKAAYSDQVVVDAKAAADIANVHAKGDPEAFQTMYSNFEKQTVAEAPDPYMGAIAKRAFLEHGAETYKKISLAKQKQTDLMDKNTYISSKKIIRDDYLKAAKGNDLAKMGDIEQRYLASSRTAIKRGFTNESLVGFEIREIQKEAYMETAMEQFRTSDNRIAYLDNMRKNKQLNSEDTSKLIDRMHKMIESEVKDYETRDILTEKEHEDLIEKTTASLNIKLLDKTLSEEDLGDALRAETITLSQYDNYKKRIKEVEVEDDEDEYLNFFYNLDAVDENDIMTADMSDEQKFKLIEKKRSRVKMTEAEARRLGEWQRVGDGKQAIAELRGYFEIIDGTIIQKLDFDNELIQDYMKLNKEMYNYVKTVDLEQKAEKALEYIRVRLDEYKAGEIIGTKPYKKRKDTEATAEAEAKRLKLAKEKEEIEGQSGFRAFFFKENK